MSQEWAKEPKFTAWFWDHVLKTRSCWWWIGSLLNTGYGQLMYKQKMYLAHRLAWLVAGKELTTGLVIDHLCRNRACVNPEHMELVTCKENILRGIGVTARNSRLTACRKGHPYNEENTYFMNGKGRSCRICKNLRRRKVTA